MAEPVPIQTLLTQFGVRATLAVTTAWSRLRHYTNTVFPTQLETWKELTLTAERI